MSHKVKLYDVTLRDGAQTEGVSFSLKDKIKIIRLLDEIGIAYIEGGWPGANPKDTELYELMKKEKLTQNAVVVAFGSTRRACNKPEDDPVLKALIESGAEQVNVFAKGWDFHVREALKITLEENLELIFDSVEYLKRYVPAVTLGIEHFFDGYKANPEYVIKIAKTAEEAGALWVGCADTNGGTLPDDIAGILTAVRKHSPLVKTIHIHQDTGLAVAGTIKAIESGVEIVHGTINGIGERCGMADFCTLIPNFKLKLGIDCGVSDEQMKRMKEVAIIVAESGGFIMNKHAPYVGKAAFFHKGGVHVDAVLKNPMTYNHIDPNLVGNEYTTSVSEMSGKANVMFLAKKYDIDIDKNDTRIKELLDHIKAQEDIGFQYEGAETSRHMIFKKLLEGYDMRVKIERYLFNMNKGAKGGDIFKTDISSQVEAVVVMNIDGNTEEIAATEERGPLAALWKAILTGVEKYYPGFAGTLRVTDLKLRVIEYSEEGIVRTLRIFLELTDMETGEKYNTVGASKDIYTAFMKALLDCIEYKIVTG
ncbi:MAG: citramalate synthase, partial [Elusimicrobiota bacterium]